MAKDQPGDSSAFRPPIEISNSTQNSYITPPYAPQMFQGSSSYPNYTSIPATTNYQPYSYQHPSYSNTPSSYHYLPNAGNYDPNYNSYQEYTPLNQQVPSTPSFTPPVNPDTSLQFPYTTQSNYGQWNYNNN